VPWLWKLGDSSNWGYPEVLRCLWCRFNKQGRIEMRTIEEIQSKISLLCKHRVDKTPEIQRNYDSSIKILRWTLGEDGSIQTLGWREMVEKTQHILEDWPRDKHSAFNTLHKIREIVNPNKVRRRAEIGDIPRGNVNKEAIS